MADVSISTPVPKIPQAIVDGTPEHLPDSNHIDSSSESSGRQPNVSGVDPMADDLAGCITAAGTMSLVTECHEEIASLVGDFEAHAMHLLLCEDNQNEFGGDGFSGPVELWRRFRACDLAAFKRYLFETGRVRRGQALGAEFGPAWRSALALRDPSLLSIAEFVIECERLTMFTRRRSCVATKVWDANCRWREID